MTRKQNSGNNKAVDWLVFSDLDGTLLDHENYSFTAAEPAIAALQQREIPLILISSKTAAEMIPIRGQMGLDAPFIVENGGGIYFPSEENRFQVRRLGADYADLEIFLSSYGRNHPRLEIVSYADLDAAALSDLTGLSLEEARLSLDREFDLPFQLEPESAAHPLKEAARQAGYRMTSGGRFHHLMGLTDKGKAARALIRHYQGLTGARPRTLGLGDSKNDLDFLHSMDVAVVIPNPGSGSPLADALPEAQVAPEPGPAGWNRMILNWLSTI